MEDDNQPDCDGQRMPWDADDPAETVRLAVEVVAKTLGQYGVGLAWKLQGEQAANALEAASAYLSSTAARLRHELDEEDGGNGPEMLSPAIQTAFEKGCAPASAELLELAIIQYRIQHLVLAGLDEPQRIWNDPAAGKSPTRAKVREEIGQICEATLAFRERLVSASGEAVARVDCIRFEDDGTIGRAQSLARQLDVLASDAESALARLPSDLSSGRVVAAKTQLALFLGDMLASRGVPVVVDGKPSRQWALAYDLALEAAGDGPCPHARKTLQNAIALRRKERMPPAA